MKKLMKKFDEKEQEKKGNERTKEDNKKEEKSKNEMIRMVRTKEDAGKNSFVGTSFLFEEKKILISKWIHPSIIN